MTVDEIDCIYRELLGRHVDSCGLEAYKGFTPDELKRKLLDSPEYAHLEYNKKECLRKMKNFTKPTYERKPHECSVFDVVICRYDEDIRIIEQFMQYPCTVYLYNKGDTITREFDDNVNIKNCENIGYEDYVYLKHISENGIKKPTLFMQCSFDHSPGMFAFLDSFENFSGFESLSQGTGERDPRPEVYLQTKYGLMYDIHVTKFIFDDILMIFSKNNNIEDFLSDRYNITVKSNYFSPGAYFYIRPENLDKSVNYDVILKDIEYCNTLGSYMSKKLASVFERYLWTNIVIHTKK